MTPPKPEQYFATPVPMSSVEFNQFLKENLLDVKTVTLPFTESNLYEDILLAKKKEYVKSPKAISKKIESVVRTLKNMPFKTTNKLIDDLDTAHEFQMLEDLESNLENDYNGKVQRKRMDSGNSNENLVNYDYGINQKMLDDFKRKLKLFENKKEDDANQTRSGNLDVTVIDLNYDKSNEEPNIAKLSDSSDLKLKSGIIENITDSASPIIEPPSPMTEPSTPETLEKPEEISNLEKPDELSYTMHNKLLYGPGKKFFSQIEQQDYTGRSNPNRFSKMFNKNMMVDNKVDDKLQLMGERTFGEMTLNKKDDTEFGQDVTIYTPESKQEDLPKLFQILSKMPNSKSGGQPTKIMISSQSYKCSVLYPKPSDESTIPSNLSK